MLLKLVSAVNAVNTLGVTGVGKKELAGGTSVISSNDIHIWTSA